LRVSKTCWAIEKLFEELTPHALEFDNLPESFAPHFSPGPFRHRVSMSFEGTRDGSNPGVADHRATQATNSHSPDGRSAIENEPSSPEIADTLQKTSFSCFR